MPSVLPFSVPEEKEREKNHRQDRWKDRQRSTAMIKTDARWGKKDVGEEERARKGRIGE